MEQHHENGVDVKQTQGGVRKLGGGWRETDPGAERHWHCSRHTPEHYALLRAWVQHRDRTVTVWYMLVQYGSERADTEKSNRFKSFKCEISNAAFDFKCCEPLHDFERKPERKSESERTGRRRSSCMMWIPSPASRATVSTRYTVAQ
eukprot:3119864-Rhodomonas_salina.1